MVLKLIGFVLFFLAGLGFGYAAPGRLKLIPLAFPVLLAIGALIRDGLQGTTILRIVLALIVTAIGLAIGYMIDQREGREAAAH